jgi:hypothetical protein
MAEDVRDVAIAGVVTDILESVRSRVEKTAEEVGIDEADIWNALVENVRNSQGTPSVEYAERRAYGLPPTPTHNRNGVLKSKIAEEDLLVYLLFSIEHHGGIIHVVIENEGQEPEDVMAGVVIKAKAFGYSIHSVNYITNVAADWSEVV